MHLICFKNLPLGKLVISTYPCEVRSWHRLPRWYSSAVAKAVHCIRFCAKGTEIWVRAMLKQGGNKTTVCFDFINRVTIFIYASFWGIIAMISTWYTYTNKEYLLVVNWESRSHTENKSGGMSEVTTKSLWQSLKDNSSSLKANQILEQ